MILVPILDRSSRSKEHIRMKSAIVALCIVACAFAAVPDEKYAEVLDSNYELSPEGSYRFGFETNNGIKGTAVGTLKVLGKDEAAVEVVGSNQYVAPNGEVIEISYVADENGYRAEGSHLPTPPPAEPIPEYIARSLDYIKAHPYIPKDGKY